MYVLYVLHVCITCAGAAAGAAVVNEAANTRPHANVQKNVPGGFKSCFDTARL